VKVFAREGRYGVVDGEGREVLPPKYRAVELLGENKAKVVVESEDGDLWEGVVELGKDQAEWNDSMAAVNERRRLYRQLAHEFERLIASWFVDACPCAYPRFRGYLGLSDKVRCLDSELLFEVFRPNAVAAGKLGDADILQCPKCGCRYSAQWREFNAFFSTVTVRPIDPYKGKPLGPAFAKPAPVCLGFQYIENLAKPDPASFRDAKVSEVLDYFA